MNYFQIKSYFWLNHSPSLVEIEVVQQRKIPFLQIIGAGSGSKSAQRERILAALESVGEKLPARKFVVQVRGTSDFPREILDLPIALAILGSANRISQRKVEKTLFWGSLTLDARLGTPEIEHFSHPPLPNWQVVGPKTSQDRVEGSSQHKKFANLRDCLSFLCSQEELPTPNRLELTESFLNPAEIRQNSLQNSLWIHLIGGFPLYLENFANEDVPQLVANLRANLLTLGASSNRSSMLSYPPEVRIIRGWNYQKRLRELQARKVSENDELSPSISLFFDLERKISLLQQYWQSQWERGELQNRTSGWIGFGKSCFCECSASCRCRSKELRDLERNQQVIEALFPLRWKRDSEVPRFSVEQAKAALKAANSRQGQKNSDLGKEQEFQCKRWQAGALQAANYLVRKSKWPAVQVLPKIALTLSDLRESSTVEEADVHEGLRYMSKLEISPFVSGKKRSSGSNPEKNSTEIP
jgi:hypothetical protein